MVVLLKKLKQQVMVWILEQYQSHHLKLLWKPGVEMGVEPEVELGVGLDQLVQLAAACH